MHKEDKGVFAVLSGFMLFGLLFYIAIIAAIAYAVVYVAHHI